MICVVVDILLIEVVACEVIVAVNINSTACYGIKNCLNSSLCFLRNLCLEVLVVSKTYAVVSECCCMVTTLE